MIQDSICMQPNTSSSKSVFGNAPPAVVMQLEMQHGYNYKRNMGFVNKSTRRKT